MKIWTPSTTDLRGDQFEAQRKKSPKSSKKQNFWSLQSIQRTHNRDGYAKLSLGFELRRHNHSWHAGDRISVIVLNNQQAIFGIYRGARHTLHRVSLNIRLLTKCVQKWLNFAKICWIGSARFSSSAISVLRIHRMAYPIVLKVFFTCSLYI